MNIPHSSKAVGAGNNITSLASKYESSGDIGTVANNPGDKGGPSYGKYQIATNTGTMASYLTYIQKNYPNQFKVLENYKPGTAKFNFAWKQLAQSDPKSFEESQYNFIKGSHYEPARASLIKSTGIDFSKRSTALQSVLYSVSTQHGSGGAAKLIKRAGITPGMSDAQIINRIYDERSADNGNRYFSSSSPQVRQSVVNRFKEERKDALQMAGGR